ncbi:MAG: helix-turn-helix domain-containing protein [Phycisphaerae bacterium]|jgi:hypothetical protein
MAKPFYSMDEVCKTLGKSPDEIRELVRAGTLREFRDAGKIFFKAEDVNQLAGGAKGDTSEIELEPAEETVGELMDELPPLTSGSGGTSVIGLEPVEEEPEEEKEDTVISASGIGVFDDDELEIDADPMAKTQITTGPVDDQVSLESSGSGSGLLDLTRESDDTSLGAELLDEIYPGEDEAATAEAEPQAAAEEEEEEAEEEAEIAQVDAGEVLAPVIVATGDPAEGIFSGFLVGALILLGVSGAVVGGVLQGYLPDYALLLTNSIGGFWGFLGASVGVVAAAVVAGWFIGRAMAPRRA